jgi:uncharacterized membrane protein
MADNESPRVPEHLAENLVGALHIERGSWTRLRRHFFAGLLVVTPLGLTVWIVAWLVNLVDGRTRNFLASLLRRFDLDYGFTLFGHQYSVVPFGFGILIVFVGICFVGMITGNFVGRWFLRGVEGLLSRVPGVNWIYSATVQVSHAFLNRNKRMFEAVVYVEFPSQGQYAIGFITASGIPNPGKPDAGKVNTVLVPKSPNPTSGYLLFIPEGECIPCPMSVEEGMKAVISGGMVLPPAIRNGSSSTQSSQQTKRPG